MMFSEKDKNNNWYVVQTRSRFEKKCHDLLSASGISAFLPLQTVEKVWSDRVKKIEMPLFPGYLFVQYDELDRYKILNTQGISKFVSFGGQYAKVHPKQIEAIEKALKFENTIEVVDIDLVPGQEMLIASGPFKGHHARLVHHNGKGKLLLSVESIGKGVLLEIGRTRMEHITQFSKVS